MSESIAVHLVQESVGNGLTWPPFPVERLWAHRMDDDLYVVDNVPFFAKGIALYDTIRVSHDPNLGLVFVEPQERSGYSTVHVFPGESRADHADAGSILAILAGGGCVLEKSGKLDMVALAVPPRVELKYVLSMLSAANAEGVLEYELAHDGTA